MKISDEVNEILPAFHKFQQEVENPVKCKEGYGYKYAPLDAVVEVVKIAMEDYGLSFNQEVSYDDDGNVLVTTNIFHESGQWLSFGPLGLPKDDGQQRSDVQAAGSSITYARRYSLSAAMGLASEEDTDGISRKKNKSKRTNKKTKSTNHIKAIKKTYNNNKEKLAPIIKKFLNDNKCDKISDLNKKQSSDLLRLLNREVS